MTEIEIRCTNCNQPYSIDSVPYKCPNCGGIFDHVDGYHFDLDEIDDHAPGIWKFRMALGLSPTTPVISLGEGNTPLVWAKAFGQDVAFKLEYLNPTGSFKDRGTAVTMSFLKSRGINEAIEDSSGNAGASFAAYAARAGLKAKIYIPDYASGPKRYQMEIFGAEVTRIQGKRSATAEAVRKMADLGATYASHAYLPHGFAGFATITYEIWEQLGEAPGTVIVPVGQGSLMLGIGRGFQALKQAKVISEIPHLIGVQALACAPIWAVFTNGASGLMWTTEGETIAEGVRIYRPLRGDVVLKTVADTNGMFVAVDEKNIIAGRSELANRGFFVEPTSAIVWNAIEQVVKNVPKPIVAILTGSGFKSLN